MNTETVTRRDLVKLRGVREIRGVTLSNLQIEVLKQRYGRLELEALVQSSVEEVLNLQVEKMKRK